MSFSLEAPQWRVLINRNIKGKKHQERRVNDRIFGENRRSQLIFPIFFGLITEGASGVAALWVEALDIPTPIVLF